MRFISTCSGIEAASIAWAPLGWKAVAFSEIEPFPCAVLQHHYPDVPNLGDMNNFKEWPDLGTIDLICGGTPCQSFSNAGLRKGLDDPRGDLMLTFGAIVGRYRPKWVVFENVPGLLSSNGGRDFGTFLGLLGFLGYGFAYRVLDAQYVRVDGYGRAVPQRRNRVYVVGCLGNWRCAAAVLLERESLRGDPAPCRNSQEDIAAGTLRSTDGGCDIDHARAGHLRPVVQGPVVGTCVTGDITHALNTANNDKGSSEDGTGRGVPMVAVPLAFGHNNTSGPVEVAGALLAHPGSGWRGDFESETFILPFDTTQITSSANPCNQKYGDSCHPLAAGPHPPAIAFDARQRDVVQYGHLTGQLDTDGTSIGLMQGRTVRRLTPRECEALMGFPLGYTLITWRGKPASDNVRYKALGNSWAVNCARWIGWRISQVESYLESKSQPPRPEPEGRGLK